MKMMMIKILYLHNLIQTIQNHMVINKFHFVNDTLFHYSVHIVSYKLLRPNKTSQCHTLQWNKQYNLSVIPVVKVLRKSVL